MSSPACTALLSKSRRPLAMLSGLPAQAFWRARRKQLRLPSFRSDDSSDDGRKSPETDQDPSDNLEVPQLRDLNASLSLLTTLFPDVRPEVFREMLAAFSEESRLELVTEQLIKHKLKWVKGRWRVPMQSGVKHKYKYRTNHQSRRDNEGLSEIEKFRSQSYKSAVRGTLYQEFKGLSHSTVRAVLAEYNYSYTDARPTLIALSSKSWKISLATLFMRRKPASPVDHPLLVWQVMASGMVQPTLKRTENEELNAELQQTLLVPLIERRIEEQVLQDAALAVQLNDAEAEDAEAMFDCEVCFISSSFEQMTACDGGAHYICYRCVQHTMREVLYGQGWARSINTERSSMKCIAPTPEIDGECHGCVPRDLVRRALGDTKEGTETWKKFEDRAAGESLMKSQARLRKCPFCVYAEVDDKRVQHNSTRNNFAAAATILAIVCLSNLVSIFVVIISLLLLPLIIVTTPLRTHPLFSAALTRTSHFTSRATTTPSVKFTCRNPACGRSSCITCAKEWFDIHICYSSERQALRSYVESAMADAVKRTCPKCNLSFVKSEACNKMTCICGYKMCYVCRKEIDKSEGYAHFCQHFRLIPGTACTECERCDLYRTEDDEVLVQKAKERAEKEWREKEGFSGGWRWEDNVPDV